MPFEGDTFVAVALRHVNEAAPDIRDVRSDVPPRLAAAIDKALQKDPARRFPTMGAFADELRACLGAAGERGRDPGDPARRGVRRARVRAGGSGRSGTSRSPCSSGGCARRRASSSAAAAGAVGSSTGSTPVHLRGVTSYDPVGQEAAVLRQHGAERDRRRSRDGMGHPDATTRRSSAGSRTASVSSLLRRAPLR